MPFSITPNLVSFTANPINRDAKTRREKVEDAATVTGGVGAGAAATRGSTAFKYFKSSEKLRSVVNGTSKAAQALSEPAQRTRSLWNALKVNYKSLKIDIANWAKASKMPKFMKGMFTGKLGSFLGGGAALFVFISGVGEVIDTTMKNINKLGVELSTK
jgi:hypothetical protein